MGMLLSRHRLANIGEMPASTFESLDGKAIKELVEMVRTRNIIIPKKSKKDDIIKLLSE